MGTKTYIDTALSVQMRETCVCKRDEPKCDRIRLWRDNSPRVLIGAAGMWRSDWRRRNVGARIGHSALWLLAFALEAIDSTGAGASGSLQTLLQIHRNMSPIMVEKD